LVVKIWRRQRFVQVTLIITRPVSDLLAHFVRDLAEIYEVVRDVDEFWRRVRSETGYLDTTSLVRNGVDCVDKIFIA
jgi:hypothetical protein